MRKARQWLFRQSGYFGNLRAWPGHVNTLRCCGAVCSGFVGHLLRRHRGLERLGQGVGDALRWPLADAARLVRILVEADFFGHLEAAVFGAFVRWQKIVGALILAAGGSRGVVLAV